VTWFATICNQQHWQNIANPYCSQQKKRPTRGWRCRINRNLEGTQPVEVSDQKMVQPEGALPRESTTARGERPKDATAGRKRQIAQPEKANDQKMALPEETLLEETTAETTEQPQDDAAGRNIEDSAAGAPPSQNEPSSFFLMPMKCNCESCHRIC